MFSQRDRDCNSQYTNKWILVILYIIASNHLNQYHLSTWYQANKSKGLRSFFEWSHRIALGIPPPWVNLGSSCIRVPCFHRALRPFDGSVDVDIPPSGCSTELDRIAAFQRIVRIPNDSISVNSCHTLEVGNALPVQEEVKVVRGSDVSSHVS